MIYKNPKLIKYRNFKDSRGFLVPFEIRDKMIKINDKFNFKMKRIFFSIGKKNYVRGNHAHKKCSQILLCLSGSIVVETIKKNKVTKFRISKNKNKVLFIPPMVWNRLHFKDNNSLLTVICDYKYDHKNEYIDDFSEFLRLSSKQ